MPNWKMKAAIQGALSATPHPQRWNRVLQRYVTRSLDMSDENFASRWKKCKRHLGVLPPEMRDRRDVRILELGTGWHPIVPVGMALMGYQRVFTIDIEDLMERKTLDDTIAMFSRCADPDLDDQRVARAVELSSEKRVSACALLSALGVEHIVCDARDIPLPDGSIDLFVSNNTFEHIGRENLVAILDEFGRLASDGAVMSHHIDMTDHYANFDPSISVFNFLRYPEPVWKFFNNSLQYQNRMRMSDYRQVHASSGWEVVDADAHRGAVDQLRAIPLAPEFCSYDEDDLRVYAAWVTSRRVRAR